MPRVKTTRKYKNKKELYSTKKELELQVDVLQDNLSVALHRIEMIRRNAWFWYGVMLVVGLTIGYLLWGGNCFVYPF